MAEVSGKVFVKLPGAASATRLTERRTIPVGTTVNATKGRAKLVGAIGGDRQARGEFWAGAFIATQKRKTKLIDLELTGGNFADCGKARTSANRTPHRAQAEGQREGAVPDHGQAHGRHGARHEVDDRGPLRVQHDRHGKGRGRCVSRRRVARRPARPGARGSL